MTSPALLKRAIGDDLVSVFVDTGLLRKGERAQVEASLTDGLGIPIVTADAGADFLGALAGVTDPEAKRKAIGRVFIDVFQREARKFSGVKFLAQGTLYPDVIESTSVRGPSAVIKSHHNVGGLPERLGFELVEDTPEGFEIPNVFLLHQFLAFLERKADRAA